jgi:hypothetical protein
MGRTPSRWAPTPYVVEHGAVETGTIICSSSQRHLEEQLATHDPIIYSTLNMELLKYR